jgi:hypothetical protein
MRTYEAKISDGDLIVIIMDEFKTSKLIIPMSDAQVLENALAELLQNAYLEGKMEGRSSLPP